MYPEFTPDVRAAMVEEAERFMDQVLWRGSGTLSELFTATDRFVPAALRPIYGQDLLVAGDGRRARASSIRGRRKGILSLAGPLTALSAPQHSRPIARGLFVLQTTAVPGAATRRRRAWPCVQINVAGCHPDNPGEIRTAFVRPDLSRVSPDLRSDRVRTGADGRHRPLPGNRVWACRWTRPGSWWGRTSDGPFTGPGRAGRLPRRKRGRCATASPARCSGSSRPEPSARGDACERQSGRRRRWRATAAEYGSCCISIVRRPSFSVTTSRALSREGVQDASAVFTARSAQGGGQHAAGSGAGEPGAGGARPASAAVVPAHADERHTSTEVLARRWLHLAHSRAASWGTRSCGPRRRSSRASTTPPGGPATSTTGGSVAFTPATARLARASRWGVASPSTSSSGTTSRCPSLIRRCTVVSSTVTGPTTPLASASAISGRSARAL